MKNWIGFGLATMAVVFSNLPAEAAIRLGSLRCMISPGVGYVIGSQKTVECRYISVFGWRERYVGRISRVGFDVGYTDGGRMAWNVYAKAKRGPGALAGTYAGAGVEAVFARGLGANILVGGFERSFALQPLSVTAQNGFEIALGISGLTLELAQ